MFFGKKKVKRSVILQKEVLDSILSYCQMSHPDEGVLILKGKSKNGEITINGLVIPPFNHTEPTFGGFPQSFLPFDSSYIGIVHSHPDGSSEPSIEDLQKFFGLVSVIVRSPYDEESVSAWDSSGNSIPISYG